MGFKSISLAVTALVLSTSVNAAPIVTYTASGSAGNYTLDFTIENTIAASYNQSLYFFGVELPDINLGAPNNWLDWNNGGTYHVASTPYESTWITGNTNNAIISGDSLSGFTIFSAAIPESVNFYAFAIGTSVYDLPDSFNGLTTNPGFQGTATLSTIPVPAAVWLFGSGLIGLVGFVRRKTNV